jgi:hypothetical protein
MPPLEKILVTGGAVQCGDFNQWMERDYGSRRATSRP